MRTIGRIISSAPFGPCASASETARTRRSSGFAESFTAYAASTKTNQPNNGTAYLAKCGSFDEAAYAAFFKDFQFKGPERFPASSLTPGS